MQNQYSVHTYKLLSPSFIRAYLLFNYSSNIRIAGKSLVAKDRIIKKAS